MTTLWPRDLIAGLDRVQHAASTDHAWPALRGVLFTGTDAGLRLAASDNYSLAEATVPVDGGARDFGTAIVRIEDIPGIRWLLKGAPKGIAMYLGRGEPSWPGGPQSVVVAHLDRTLTLRPVDAPYPNYQVIFDQAERVDRRVVNVQGALLRDASRAAGKGEFGLRLSVGGPVDPVIVTGSAAGDTYREAIMPIRDAAAPADAVRRAAVDLAERDAARKAVEA